MSTLRLALGQAGRAFRSNLPAMAAVLGAFFLPATSSLLLFFNTT